MSFVLDSTSLKLEAVLAGAVSANQPEVTVTYVAYNRDGREAKPATYRTALNSASDVSILAAPSVAGVVLEPRFISIYNKDTASVTVTVKTDDGTTERIICKATLATLEVLIYENGKGWYALNTSGAIKATNNGIPETLIDAKGDLIAGTADNTAARVAVGANNTVLVANSAATPGVNWSATLAGLTLTAPTFTGAVDEARRASTYVYTAWDPSSSGAVTNASNSSAATSTATNYITVANSSGTTTWTCVKSGVYRFTINMQNENGTTSTLMYAPTAIGGTATILLGSATLLTVIYEESASLSGSSQISGTGVFYAVMTATQTVTVLPKIAVISASAMTFFTQQCAVTAEYVGED